MTHSMKIKTSPDEQVCIMYTSVCVPQSVTLNIDCSTMRGRIKGTDSTINAILATAVLYELRWKIWNGEE